PIAPLPAVIFLLTFVTNLALAAVSFDAVRRHLGADRRAAAIAALLAVANSSFSLGLAGFLRFESYQAASLAIPLSLLGLSLLIAGRRLRGAACLALSALFHPLIGVEAAAISYGACGLAEVVRARSLVGAALALLRYVPSGLVFCAVVLLAWALPSLVRPTEHIPDAEFFATLAVFRAPHHYLATAFPAAHYLSALAFAAASGCLWLGHVRENGPRFETTALAFAAAIVIGMCATSYVLVDILESRVFMTAQVFRMLLILKWIGFLLLAWAASRWMRQGDALHWIAATAPMIVAGDGQPLVMVAALVTVAAAKRLKPGIAQANVAAALVVVFSIAVAAKVGVREEMLRAAVGVACLSVFYGRGLEQWPLRAGAAALVGSLIAFGWINRDLHVTDIDAFRPTYGFGDLEESDADIARWAKSHTPSNSTWVTPPDFERFRLIAERPIVVDFTSIPFNDLAMREWKARMTALYGEGKGGGFSALNSMDRNYRESSPAALRSAGERFGADYAVLYAETPWPGPVLYRNAHYKAVRLAL
ncbi:MAG: hypothetical protein H6R45_409, partial [Proteobacteria bacterium]|nr:hypothetical protein [Pseudomonadota bacterium]